MIRFFAIAFCIFVLAGVTAMAIIIIAYPLRYEDEIMMASARFDIEPDLIASIIRAESNFKHDAISSRGAGGLMQIMPATARFIGDKIGIERGHDKLFDPETNIILGTAYLRYLIDKFDDIRTVLFAYNAGEGKVATWLTMDDFSEEQDGRRILITSPYPASNAYVDRVLGSRWVYRFRI